MIAARIQSAFARRWVQALWLLGFALFTRISVFGDTNYFTDELLYLQIGQRMHDGLWPYVDLWDRKGPGLFALFWLIAALPGGVIAYQVAAWLFAGATGIVIERMAERFTGTVGAMLAAMVYLAMLPLYAGGGGQAAVFYNLFIALGALLVLHGRLVPAMAFAGLAASFKQTALIEGAFLGLWGLWQVRAHSRGNLLRTIAAMALAGAAPMLAGMAIYALSGHFGAFWHAMVTSNLAKTYQPDDPLGRLIALAIVGVPVLVPAVAGLAMPLRPGAPRGFIAGWLIAAFAAFALLPNLIDHYMLPVLVPLSIAAAPALGFRRVGPVWAAVAIWLTLLAGPALNFTARHQSRAQMERLVNTVQRHEPHPRLFIYQGPPYLYRLIGRYPPSPLFFPFHLHAAPEDNTSWMDTREEVRRVLEWQPQVVIVEQNLRARASNLRTRALVEDYLRRCRLWAEQDVTDYYGPNRIAVYGDCARQDDSGAKIQTGR